MTTAVLIPAYDAAWCLETVIESVRGQTKRPDEVWIGCDGCPASVAIAQSLRRKYEPRRGISRSKTLDIRVVYFPANVGPYRVKNTMALLTYCEALQFFDADDIMFPNHVEMMTKALAPDNFMRAEANVQWPDGRIEEWQNAHGIVGIMRETFIRHGGFEGWRCAADAEAHIRWEKGGLTRCKPVEPTCLVRKHDGSITRSPETGYESPIRKLYRETIKNRKLWPERIASIDIADFVVLDPGQSVETCEAYENALDMPQDDVIQAYEQQCETEKRIQEGTADMQTAVSLLATLARVNGRGIERRNRRAYDRAAEFLNRKGVKI